MKKEKQPRTKASPAQAPRGSARTAAFEAMKAWNDGEVYARELLDREAQRFNLGGADRALAQEVFFGALRHLSFLDRLIAELRKTGPLKRPVREILRLGLYQLFKTEIPEHAVVHETVSLAQKRERGLVNAILREALRQRDRLMEAAQKWPVADRLSHPPFLIERWTRQFGEAAALSLCEWNNRPPAVFARICDAAAYEAAVSSGDSALRPEAVESFPGFVKLPPGPVPPSWIEKGIIFIQDPATSLACRLLDPQPGECLLDACAAPGGKTALLRSLAPPGCRLFATDASASRLRLLRQNLDRLGIDDVEVSQADWSGPAPPFPGQFPAFDAILLDVPCSNTGVMRRRVDVRWRLRPRDFAELAALQGQILKNAALCLKPGGRIVYSTCSLEEEENQGVIEACGMEIEAVSQSVPWRSGVDGAFAARLRLRS